MQTRRDSGLLARRIKILWLRWRRQAVFLAGGVSVGLVAVGFARLADLAREVQLEAFARVGSLVLFAVPVGFAALAWLTRRLAPAAAGSGIPQAIAARALADQNARRNLVSIHVALGKIALTVAGIALGASIGREGPTVQVGAAIMLATGRLSPRRLKGLVLAGGAAGVAAAFNTPLAGIVFAIEELSRDYERRASVGVIAAVITAGLTSLALVGNYTYFGSTAATVGGWSEWAAVPVCGIVFGIAGGVFSRLLIACSVPSEGQFARFRRARPIAFASACGLGVAMLGLLTSGATFGTGYAEARSLLHGGGAYALFGPAKLAATLLSAISGIPGGIFAPSLTVGAGLGAELARVMGGQGGEALVLMGMVAYFAGVVQAPITAFVIVMEMTENHAMLLPLMAAAVLAQGVSRIVCPRSLYHALAEGYVAMASRNGRIVAEATAPKAPL